MTSGATDSAGVPWAGRDLRSQPFAGDDGAADPALVAALQAAGTKWAAAAVGSMEGGTLALQSGTTVMSIGGFTGSDPAPTLEQFQAYVAAGQIRYFVPGGGPGGGGPGGSPERAGGGGRDSNSSSAQISAWVEQTFASTDIGGRTVYDLARPAG